MAKALVVAESKFFADSGSGTRFPVHVRIYMPHQNGRHFACRVQMGRIAPSVEAGGADTMQALALGVRFVNNVLARRHQQGWRFFFSKDEKKPFAFWQIWGHSPRLSSFCIPGDPEP